MDGSVVGCRQGVGGMRLFGHFQRIFAIRATAQSLPEKGAA
jgi:hypothetical protein